MLLLTAAKIATVSKRAYRNALLKRLETFGNDPKKAFTGKNCIGKESALCLISIRPYEFRRRYKQLNLKLFILSENRSILHLNVDKVVDVKVRAILERRLKEYGGDPKKAFVNFW